MKTKTSELVGRDEVDVPEELTQQLGTYSK